MRQSIRTLLLATACAGLSIGTARAEVSDADRAFIDKLAMGGHGGGGQRRDRGQERRTRPSPTSASRWSSEHGEMNDELAALAKQKGVEPPTSASLTDQAKGAVMSVMPGATFDKQYVSQQLSDHKETLALLEKEASSGDDPDLKAFASKAIPVVQKHITELEALDKQLGS